MALRNVGKFTPCSATDGSAPSGIGLIATSCGGSLTRGHPRLNRYNTEHRHSALNYVTPQQHHTGEFDQFLAKRKQVIEAAKVANTQRCSGKTRNLSLPDSDTLNPEKAAKF